MDETMGAPGIMCPESIEGFGVCRRTVVNCLSYGGGWQAPERRTEALAGVSPGNWVAYLVAKPAPMLSAGGGGVVSFSCICVSCV